MRGVEGLEDSRRRKETALADLREMEVQKRRGELLEADEVRREWEDVLRQIRAGVLSVVGRLRGLLPHLTPADFVAIDAELRVVLTVLGEDRPA